jgi:hypothetical protein
MAKVITEIGVGAAAIGAAFLLPGMGIALSASMTSALISGGASFVLQGIGDALKRNQGGLAVAVKSPIGPWGYVYGTQKVGGVKIFEQSNNSQGVSSNKQLHQVYALACHPCSLGNWQLRIGGRQILMRPATYGYGYSSYSPTQVTANITSISRVSGVVTMVLDNPIAGADGLNLQVTGVADNTFNGLWVVTQPNPADNTTFTYVCGGADTTTSGGYVKTTYADYRDKLYLEFLNGHHTQTFQGLLASGTNWGATDLCLGRTLAYIRMGYDSSVFPSGIPDVSFIIDGKDDILDPRTGTRGFTRNAALCVADYLSIPPSKGGFGLAIDADIPTAQLIAAANTCDELVTLAGGGTQARYSCDTYVQLTQGRGSILSDMLTSCAGRISYQGGAYSISPAAWTAPTLQLTDADLVGPIEWHPRFSIRDTCNAVKGTYVSPENSYQQGDIPPYMQDAEHGYSSDQYLAEDNGERIFREANFPCTDSSAAAQRLAKIAMMRTRFQGRGTIRCSMKAYQAVALDVIQLTHPRYGWTNKNFEVLSSRFIVDKETGRLSVELDIAETDPSIYDWSTVEQLTPQGYKEPSNVGLTVCTPPEALSLYSGYGATVGGITYPSTISISADGSTRNSLYVLWQSPNDTFVTNGGHIEVQYQRSGASTWTEFGKLDGGATNCFIGNVSDSVTYNVQIRSINKAGVVSDWKSASCTTVSVVSLPSYTGQDVAPAGTLTGLAVTGSAEIDIANFTATVGTATASCVPSPSALTGLNQGQSYYVYYVDAAFAGGTITPIATQNSSDFLNKAGYFLIGVVLTPTSGAGTYRPVSYYDAGDLTTTSPANAYDAYPTTTCAFVNGQNTTANGPANADCTFSGFASYTTTATMTLTVSALLAVSHVSTASMINANIGGTAYTLFNASTGTALADYTHTIPTGTNLASISIEATAGTPTTAGGYTSSLRIYDIRIQ